MKRVLMLFNYNFHFTKSHFEFATYIFVSLYRTGVATAQLAQACDAALMTYLKELDFLHFLFI
jgi:hypothetical protein